LRLSALLNVAASAFGLISFWLYLPGALSSKRGLEMPICVLGASVGSFKVLG